MLIERNFGMAKGLPFLPIRGDQYRMGPGESSLIAMDTISATGTTRGRDAKTSTMSRRRFMNKEKTCNE